MSDDIIPAILATSVSDLDSKLAEIPDGVKLVHIDVLEEDIWTDCKIDFEVHLMVKDPEAILDRWIKRGAKRIIVHRLSVETARLKGRVEIGLGVELQVPLEEIFPLVSEIDFIHLMSIAEIGEQGHPLDERIFDRIREVREHFPGLVIGVDGGVNVANLITLKNLGATRLVVGSGFKDLWKSLMKN